MFNALVVAVAFTGSDRATGAARNLAGRAGLPVETLSVPDGGDVAAAIVEHVRAHDGALLVMSTGGTYLLSQARRSIASDVLERLCQPVLLLGPHCTQQADASTLVVGVDRTNETQHGIHVADAWRRTFGAVETRLVDVVAESSWPPESTDEGIDAPAGPRCCARTTRRRHWWRSARPSTMRSSS